MTAPHRTLVAGIGNVLFGDDGFGVEVLRRLDTGRLPAGAYAREYGIRGVHLAYDLLDGEFATLLIVDAVPGQDPPGTLTLMQVEDPDPDAAPTVEGHSMTPQSVLGTLRSIGGRVGNVLVLGCRPASIAPGIGLSPAVESAVGAATGLVIDLTADLAGREAALHVADRG